MTAWVVRAGERGEWEETALSEGLVGIGFHVRTPHLQFHDAESN